MSSKWLKNKDAMHAVYIASMCSVSYLAVYVARNVLGVVTPQMIEGGYSAEYIGKLSSVYFIAYAVGQLINGSIGDRVKARYMVSIGLLIAGMTNVLFPLISGAYPYTALVVYGVTGLGLSMIYGPITKAVAENTLPIYAPRCSLGYSFASFIGSPIAGVAAAVMTWQLVFFTSSAVLVTMSVLCFSVFLLFEKKGIIRYNQYKREKKQGGSVKLLFKRGIIKFTAFSMITGVVRTAVVFWLPTYLSQYLGFSAQQAPAIFTAATFVIAMAAFVSIFTYEKIMKRNMDLTIRAMFISAAVFFLLVYFVKQPVLNIVFLVLAVMSSNSVATMIWSRYCPSLRDTGLVSSVTGYLDFMSYIAASISSSLFANVVTVIGWGKLVMIWCALMAAGVVISLPYDKYRGRDISEQTRNSNGDRIAP